MDHRMLSINETLLGKRLRQDMFSQEGALVLPAGTVLNKIHLETITGHGLKLPVNEVEEVGPYADLSAGGSHHTEIEEAVGIVREAFEQMRLSRQIPLAGIRSRVIPLIRSSTGQLHLFQLLATLQAKDDYLYRHSVAVGAISMLLGKWLELGEAELLQLTTAAILHDAGMTQIASELLIKPERLTEDEYDTMKRHTLLGYDMIKKTVGATHRQAAVALQHHERIDGSGYPFGLKSGKIDLFSRIVAVADVFHAMSSKTEYRNPSPVYRVLQQMESHAYGTFDPAVVAVLIRKFMQALLGYKVMLSDGTEGKIVLIHPHHQTRPLVQTNDGFIDLSKDYNTQIEQVLARHETEAEASLQEAAPGSGS
ncbi:MAG: hypothetical protein K0Q94_821 [Paenibacillus sp.]|jgi:HD-GYP domain-containing protein (c-di-GMP phosphodiesterase class II)|nr:hypothetical protein [Paenibacillus sp.]